MSDLPGAAARGEGDPRRSAAGAAPRPRTSPRATRTGARRRLAVLAAAAAAAALGPALAACGHAIPVYRLDPTGYVYEGYLLGTTDGLSVVVEEIRYRPELKGSIIFDLAFVNQGARPAKIDLGLIEVQVSDREVLANEARALLVQPGTVERVTLSFRTDQQPHQLERGVLKVSGIALDSGARFELVAGFHQASERELEEER